MKRCRSDQRMIASSMASIFGSSRAGRGTDRTSRRGCRPSPRLPPASNRPAPQRRDPAAAQFAPFAAGTPSAIRGRIRRNCTPPTGPPRRAQRALIVSTNRHRGRAERVGPQPTARVRHFGMGMDEPSFFIQCRTDPVQFADDWRSDVAVGPKFDPLAIARREASSGRNRARRERRQVGNREEQMLGGDWLATDGFPFDDRSVERCDDGQEVGGGGAGRQILSISSSDMPRYRRRPRSSSSGKPASSPRSGRPR